MLLREASKPQILVLVGCLSQMGKFGKGALVGEGEEERPPFNS